MKFLQLISRWSRPNRCKQAQLLWQQGCTQVLMKNYESAHASFLQLLDYRNELEAAGVLEQALRSLGSVWLTLEQYEDMNRFFSGYISQFPNDPEGYFNRACAAWYSDHLETAFQDYSRALELNAKHTPARSDRGQVLAEMARHEQAMVDFDIALQEFKEAQDSAPPVWNEFYRQCHAFLHRGRGVALAGLGLQKKAMEEFEVSANLHPGNAWVYFSRAKIHDAQGNEEKALNDYQAALTRDDPALTPIQRQRAQARLHELSNKHRP